MLAVASAPSVTWTVKVKVPAEVGVPLRIPARAPPIVVVVREVPAGGVPAVMAQFL
jgi:hypothetical protein